MGRKVRVSKGRDVLEIPEDRVSDARARGYEVVSGEAAAQIGRAKDAAGIAGGVRGFVSGAASTATWGGTNVALKALGADPEQLKADQEGGAGTLGQVVGAVAPALLTGGTGALGAAARLTPAGRAAMLAGRAGAAVKGAGGALRTGAALGVEGAVEGALQGAGMAVTEAALNDDPITAESVVAGAGKNAGLGFLFGGALGVAGGGMAAAARAGMQGGGKMLRRAPDVADGLQGVAISEAAKKKTIKLWSQVAGVDEGALSRSIDRLGTKEGAARMVGDLSATREKVGKQLQSTIGEANDAFESLAKATGGETRVGNAARLMSGAERGVVQPRAMEFLRAERGRIDEMLGDELLTSAAKRDLKRLRRLNEKAQKRVRANKDGADNFRAIDEYKQGTYQLKAGREAQLKGPNVDPEVKELAKALRTFDDANKGHIWDESIYGAAAKSHKADSTAWAEAMGAAESLSKKSPRLAKLLRRGSEGADIDATMYLAGQYTKTRGATKANLFDNAIEQRLTAVKKLRETNDLAPEISSKIDDFEKSVEKMRKELAEQGEHAAAVDDMWKLRNAETNFSPTQTVLSTVGPTVGAALGSTLGPIGAAAGFAAGHLMAPSRLIKTAASLRATVDKVAFDMGGAVAGFAALADGTKKAARGSGRSVARAARTAAATQDAKKQRDARLKKTIQKVNEYAANPVMLAEALRDDDLFDVAPKAAGQAMATSVRAVQFLQSVQPASFKPTFGGGIEMFDPIEMDNYSRYVEAVVDPMRSMSRLSTGTMTVEHAKALKFVYPLLYADMQSRIMEELGEREAAGRPVRFAARIQLGILGDMPADDSMRPAMLVAINQAHAATAAAEAAEQSASRGSGLGKADMNRSSLRTERDRIALGGESS